MNWCLTPLAFLEHVVTDPRGIVTDTGTDLLGRTIAAIAAFVDGVPSNADDQSTTYTYDGDGNVLTMTAVMPVGTNSQTTAYVYGAGSTVGTDLFSNDLIAKTEFPDTTTGLASTSAANDQTYTYNWQADKTTLTDQNGSVHTYTYDSLDRLTLDAVTTLGTGVNGTVRALGYSFDTGDRPYQDTSYSNSNGTGVVNQVQFAYDGFGQEATEYQATTGAVNIVTTPAVRYLYTENAGSQNNDRLMAMIYPNASYALSSLTHSGTTATATMASNIYNVGDSVTVSGATPAAYNGTYAVTAVNTTSHTFSYVMTSTPGSNASGANMVVTNVRTEDYLYGAAEYPLTSIIHSGTTATAAMGSNVYSVGNSVTVSGADQSAYNGTFTVTAVNTTNKTFSYTMGSTPSSDATGVDLLVTTPGTTLNGAISRVSSLMDHQGTSAGVHLEEYTYLGLSTIVAMNRPQANEELTYIQVSGDTLHGSDGGDRYTGLDRFGRVVDQYWLNTASSPAAIDRLQYGYDRDGNVLFEKNLLQSNFSELFHNNAAVSGDDNSAYDLLNRVINMRRGTLSASAFNGGVLDTVTTLNSVSGVTGNQKSWSLNAVGDWSSVTTDGTATSHTTNAQNEITAVGASAMTSDNDGNVTKNSQGYTLTYDAWNRLMTSSDTSLTMGYDALGRWVHQVYSGGTNENYYDNSGRMIETYDAGVYVENVWGIAYVNELVLRDKNADGSSTGSYGVAGSHLEQRLYVNFDANWDTTSLYQVNGTPGVAERIIYDPYGTPILLTSAWASYSSSTIYFRILYQGTYWLAEANVQVMGARMYDYTTGAWDQKDPETYINGTDCYQFALSEPIDNVDPLGMDTETNLGDKDVKVDVGIIRLKRQIVIQGKIGSSAALRNTIVFFPKAGACPICSKIRFVQIVRPTDSFGKHGLKDVLTLSGLEPIQTPSGWILDVLNTKVHKGMPASQYYSDYSTTPGQQDASSTGDVNTRGIMFDIPSVPNTANASFEAETYVVCVATNKVLAGVSWGFDFKDGKLTATDPAPLNAPSQDYNDALGKFNGYVGNK